MLVEDWDQRVPWRHSTGSISAGELLLGSPDTGLKVVSATASTKPTKTELIAVWKARAGQSADPVVVVVEYEHDRHSRYALFGPRADAVPMLDLGFELTGRILLEALNTASPTALESHFRRLVESVSRGTAAGFRNEGLFATHVLEQQPERPDWTSLCERSRPLLGKRGEALIKQLGYTTEAMVGGVVLRDPEDGQRRAVAVLLTDDEALDNPLTRFHGSNAVTHGLALARRESVDWLLVTRGSVARLYPSDPDVGLGRKGETQTYAEIDLALLSDAESGYLTLLLSPQALAPCGSVGTLLGESAKYATGLSERLRDRIYENVIPNLAVAIAEANAVQRVGKDRLKAALDDSYHQTMIVLFRLLFVAYAEDRGLLPLDRNDAYTSNALKTLARRILDEPDQGFSGTSTSMWADLVQVWDVIDRGDLEGMGVPAYNGGLFTREIDASRLGAATYDLRLTNAVIGPVLKGLLIDTTKDDVLGMVDFRSLDVREFGTIYEGLLESGLGVADTDLALDDNQTYVPAKYGSDVEVLDGEVYFHSRSGSRKATGSYFTKPFAVQHLLDHALEPALDAHLARVRQLIDRGVNKTAAEALFDFRVADLSMGSAHFLVAAVDRIEARFSSFLTENPLPEVAVELHRLRIMAARQLGIAPEDSGIDDGILLRRQIARRCIYGVDVNEIAVELARLAVWIHTFVPGLPLSFLNHGLICGNSLTGVGTIKEIVSSLTEAEQRELRQQRIGDDTLVVDVLGDFLDRAGDHLYRLAELSGASVAEVHRASEVQQEIEAALEPLSALCDLITAERTTRHLKAKDPDRIQLSAGGGQLFVVADAASLEKAVLDHPQLDRAREIASSVQAAHLPVRFAEVFRRDPAGFDVILGNPPWEKLKVEEHGWWGARFPGLRSMSQKDKNEALERYREERPDLVAEYDAEVTRAKSANQILAAGPFPGLRAATDIDLFAAFCWRFWHEVRSGGRIGVVLPRTALGGAATSQWRKSVLVEGSMSDVTTLINSARWAFDMEPRYTVALITIERGSQEHRVRLRGPFHSRSGWEDGMAMGDAGLATVAAPTVLSWSETAAIPQIPASDVDVFAAMRRHPSLDADVGSWHFRPIRELHTTDNKSFFDFDVENPAPGNTLPVLTGGSFDLWSPDAGPPYAFSDPAVIIPFLFERRALSMKKANTVFTGRDVARPDTHESLSMHHLRIAFRDVTNPTNSRTMICALLPSEVTLVHVAPYLYRQRGGPCDEAYLLGVLSSLPFDWFTRRFVELHMTYGLLNSFPVPRFDPMSGLRVKGQ